MFAALHIKRVMDAIERAVVAPQVEIIVHRATWRQIFRDRPPLAPGANYVGPTVIGGVANNGNGFGDWTLSSVSLAGLASTATVLFHAVWNNASDGGESDSS